MHCAGVPTFGVFFPASADGISSYYATPLGTVISLDQGGYFESNDGTRYTCTAMAGCMIFNGTVTTGTVVTGTVATGTAEDADMERFLSLPDADSESGKEGIVTAVSAGRLIRMPANHFDLEGKTLSFTPNDAGAYHVTVSDLDWLDPGSLPDSLSHEFDRWDDYAAIDSRGHGCM